MILWRRSNCSREILLLFHDFGPHICAGFFLFLCVILRLNFALIFNFMLELTIHKKKEVSFLTISHKIQQLKNKKLQLTRFRFGVDPWQHFQKSLANLEEVVKNQDREFNPAWLVLQWKSLPMMYQLLFFRQATDLEVLGLIIQTLQDDGLFPLREECKSYKENIVHHLVNGRLSYQKIDQYFFPDSDKVIDRAKKSQLANLLLFGMVSRFGAMAWQELSDLAAKSGMLTRNFLYNTGVISSLQCAYFEYTTNPKLAIQMQRVSDYLRRGAKTSC